MTMFLAAAFVVFAAPDSASEKELFDLITFEAHSSYTKALCSLVQKSEWMLASAYVSNGTFCCPVVASALLNLFL
eukprot:6189973-Pleurochrysis_carterae.AAC.4